MRFPRSSSEGDVAGEGASSRSRPAEAPPAPVWPFAALSAVSFLAYLGASRAVREFLGLAGILWRRLLELVG